MLLNEIVWTIIVIITNKINNKNLPLQCVKCWLTIDKNKLYLFDLQNQLNLVCSIV